MPTFLLLVSSLLAQNSTSYEEWLHNQGYYLLTSEQKEKFRALPDTEKEFYIRNLWNSLDPNPMTPENEFQAEYEKRFQYVKKYYSVPSDRAKIYLLLGPPNSVESYPNSNKYYPMELWSYYSLGYRGLPPSLDLIFFKRWGTGDYRLYSPLFDGLKALSPTDLNFQSARTQAQLKSIFDASVVDASERLSVGASGIESEEIRAALQDPAAIEKILIQKRRPTVETTVVYQGFEASVSTYSVPYEGDIQRTSIAIAVPPKYLTFEKDNDAYRARVDLVGKITNESDKEILRINDSPAIKMTESELERAKTYLFSYSFDAYLLPGKYTLELVYRDYASNAAGKMEKSFEVKAITGELELLTPLLAYKSAPSTSEQMPFGYDWQQYYPKENTIFNNGQLLVLYTKLLNPQKTKLDGLWQLQMVLKQNGESVLEVSESLPISTSTDMDLNRRIRLQSLIPGSYVLSLKLSQANVTLTAETPLKISLDTEILGRIRIVPSSSFTPEGYHTNLALQYYTLNELTEAARHARIALDFAPSSYPARSLSARIEKAKGNTDAAITAYEKLVAESPADSEGFFLIGKWSLEKADWGKASENLKRAMALGYYTTELLNDLAEAQLQLGHKTEAVDYWEKSLALNANQPDIEKQLSTYKQ